MEVSKFFRFGLISNTVSNYSNFIILSITNVSIFFYVFLCGVYTHFRSDHKHPLIFTSVHMCRGQCGPCIIIGDIEKFHRRSSCYSFQMNYILSLSSESHYYVNNFYALIAFSCRHAIMNCFDINNQGSQFVVTMLINSE